MITDKEYMRIGFAVAKVGIVSFLVGIFVGYLIF